MTGMHAPLVDRDLDDDVLLPSQLLGEREWAPEQKLCLAALLAALRGALMQSESRVISSSSDRAWIASEQEHVYSFRWCCAVLAFDPEALRRAMHLRPSTVGTNGDRAFYGHGRNYRPPHTPVIPRRPQVTVA